MHVYRMTVNSEKCPHNFQKPNIGREIPKFYYHIKQRKAAYPHDLAARFRECLAILL